MFYYDCSLENIVFVLNIKTLIIIAHFKFNLLHIQEYNKIILILQFIRITEK